MPPPIRRPENALKRADELISVGESQAALQSLFDFVTARRIRFADPSTIEPIFFRFLELGVELKRGKQIKDALYQYKKLVQGSVEGLISVGVISRKFIDIVEKRMAAEESKENLKEVTDDDLEGGITPENLLISAYEEDQSVGGFKDEEFTSWMRFTWESYRAALDLLRNNSQLEITYSGVVNRTMNFCLKYGRKTEFRRLADLLRQHLDAANYHQSKTGANIVDLSDSDTLQRYLDQRFQLVNCSVKLEMWQEAYRAIEDVFHLMKMSNVTPKTSTLANYYENVAKVFFVGGDDTLHTIAWKKFYELYQTNPKASEDDFKYYASTVFLSALAIKLDDLPTVGYNPQLRLYRLLDLEGKPTRSEVLASLLEHPLYKVVDDDIKQLYVIMEADFDLDTLSAKLTELLPKLLEKPYFERYATRLRDTIVRKAIVQASIKYDTVSMDELFTLLTFPAPLDMTSWDIERALLQASMEDYVSITIDQGKRDVTFSKDPFGKFIQIATHAAEEAAAREAAKAGVSEAAVTAEEEGVVDEEEEEEAEEPELEEEEGEVVEEEEVAAEGEATEGGEAPVAPEIVITRNYGVRRRLGQLAMTLNEMEGFSGVSYLEKIKVARERLLQRHKEFVERANQTAEERARRRQEERMKYLTNVAESAEQDAELKQRKYLEEKAAIDAKLAEDAHRRLVEKKKRELQELKEREARKMIEEVNKNGHVYIDPDLAATLDLRDLKKVIVEKLSKDKDELNDKMTYALKRLDHTERAYRKVELPILRKEAEELQEPDRRKYEENKKKVIEAAKAEYQQKIDDHERLVAVFADYKALKDRLIAEHEAEVAPRRKELKEKLEAAKKARIEEVREKRFKEAVAQREAEKARAERAARAEAERELLRKRMELEEASMRKNAERSPAPAAASPPARRVNPFGNIDDAKREEIARRQREMEAMLEKKAAGTASSPSPAAAEPRRGGYVPPSKRGAYVPPSRRGQR